MIGEPRKVVAYDSQKGRLYFYNKFLPTPSSFIEKLSAMKFSVFLQKKTKTLFVCTFS